MSVLFGDGRKEVASAGTAEALSDISQAFTYLTITAETNNTGVIVVGGSTVVASLATRRGSPLNAGDSYTLNVKGQESGNLKDIFIDSTVSTDGVTYTYQFETFPNS